MPRPHTSGAGERALSTPRFLVRRQPSHAIAARLEQEGEEVELLAILDAYPIVPADQSVSVLDEREALSLTLEEMGFGRPIPSEGPIPWDDITDFLRRSGNPLGYLERPLLASINRIHLNNVRLTEQLTEQPRPANFSGTALHFRATRGSRDMPPASSWTPYVGSIELYEIDCRHTEMMDPGPLAEIGRRLQAKLDRCASNGRASGSTTRLISDRPFNYEPIGAAAR